MSTQFLTNKNEFQQFKAKLVLERFLSRIRINCIEVYYPAEKYETLTSAVSLAAPHINEIIDLPDEEDSAQITNGLVSSCNGIVPGCIALAILKEDSRIVENTKHRNDEQIAFVRAILRYNTSDIQIYSNSLLMNRQIIDSRILQKMTLVLLHYQNDDRGKLVVDYHDQQPIEKTHNSNHQFLTDLEITTSIASIKTHTFGTAAKQPFIKTWFSKSFTNCVDTDESRILEYISAADVNRNAEQVAGNAKELIKVTLNFKEIRNSDEDNGANVLASSETTLFDFSEEPLNDGNCIQTCLNEDDEYLNINLEVANANGVNDNNQKIEASVASAKDTDEASDASTGDICSDINGKRVVDINHLDSTESDLSTDDNNEAAKTINDVESDMIQHARAKMIRQGDLDKIETEPRWITID
ncbi:uncharacterized protein ASCRUDRAFT_8841 [Ascoidea rubescens DSM 1968]|uniref:Uncharacterized protein n=1 Tax=Ascoidea rubescens DSM 1968 TaxID=1344418 RepID=A0A1D2VEK6_9ASCO|nr:hypothetical protein ASCRUDRAFT_8841 [Ascoidea rubescens DSM 1968]ODV60066.1 hypothetical protein ASCRUDRAFT_8841 [Ascoidea rubescens DSM 1968]